MTRRTKFIVVSSLAIGAACWVQDQINGPDASIVTMVTWFVLGAGIGMLLERFTRPKAR